MTRKQARDVVYKMTYAADIHGKDAEDAFDVFVSHWDEEYAAGAEWDEHDGNTKYIRDSFVEILQNFNKLDSIINALAHNWQTSRLSKTTLAALRYGVYELTQSQEEIPANVAIKEATDLAGLYEGEQAAGFVNGVLAKYNSGLTVDANSDMAD